MFKFVQEVFGNDQGRGMRDIGDGVMRVMRVMG
jgi:hypothetical protein